MSRNHPPNIDQINLPKTEIVIITLDVVVRAKAVDDQIALSTNSENLSGNGIDARTNTLSDFLS